MHRRTPVRRRHLTPNPKSGRNGRSSAADDRLQHGHDRLPTSDEPPPCDRKDSRRDGGGAQERQADAQQQRAAERIAQARDPVAGEASVEQFPWREPPHTPRARLPRRRRRRRAWRVPAYAGEVVCCPQPRSTTQAPRDEHHPDKQSKPRENLARSVTYVIKGVVPEGDVADDVNCEVREKAAAAETAATNRRDQQRETAHVARSSLAYRMNLSG